MTSVAKPVFVSYVGKSSAEGGRGTVASDDVLTKLVYITRLQVPPRAPKRQSKGCLFFCQYILAKTDKTPVFLISNRKTGIFYLVSVRLIQLQVFPSVSVGSAVNSPPDGEWAVQS